MVLGTKVLRKKNNLEYKNNMKLSDIDLLITHFNLEEIIKLNEALEIPLGEYLAELVRRYGMENTLEDAGIEISIYEETKLADGGRSAVVGKEWIFENVELMQDKLDKYNVPYQTWCKNLNDTLTGEGYDRVDNLIIYPEANFNCRPWYPQDIYDRLRERYENEQVEATKDHLRGLMEITKRIRYR